MTSSFTDGRSANDGGLALAELLVSADGKPVNDRNQWESKRRGEVLDLFADQVYGRTPGSAPPGMRFEVIESSDTALNGKATRKQVAVFFTAEDDAPRMNLLIYLPNEATRPVPMFVGLNFHGNHTIHSDPAIVLPTAWVRDNERFGATNNRATDAGRGVSAERWQVESVIDRGYGTATIYCGDLFPDQSSMYAQSVLSLFSDNPEQRTANSWGAIGAWAWGLSRALDYFETDADIDATRTTVHGHSRLGKTALWAGAQDPRFAIVISNDSGCGGAALSLRRSGETVQKINKAFPHWFALNFRQYDEAEDKLPVDQHMLIALMAPRPVYVASAVEDTWADPLGEFLSARYAQPVYDLYELPGVGVDEQPAIDQPVGDHVGYHVRTGKHDVTAYDWAQFLNFADRHFQ